MKRILFLVLLVVTAGLARAQKVDSIYFHLYTDSLKKGQHNYINVDGKLSNGRWLPLTSKEVQFSCEEASFEGNELVIPSDFKPAKVTIRATLKSNPSVVIATTVWIKQKPDGALPSRDQLMDGNQGRRGRNRR